VCSSDLATTVVRNVVTIFHLTQRNVAEHRRLQETGR
jgi:hypothetical protein